MELAFLGTGAAFSSERYNGAVVVDGRLLLDAGAPLLPHMRRADIDPAGIEAIFLTHFHGDHMAGLIPYLAWRAYGRLGPLALVTPAGGGERVDALMTAAWGDEWREWLDAGFVLERVVAADGEGGSAAGVRFETVRLDHSGVDGHGYRVHLDGRVLAYAGDTRATPPLERLVEGADVVITEATGPGPIASHTSWEEAAALRARHPGTRFFFNHVYAGELEGAAHDLQVISV
jgi:ribonuclease BN (tRNA processing enzyme)